VISSIYEIITFYTAGRPIEFVESFSHLGHFLTKDLDDDGDICLIRSKLISQTNNVLCYVRQLDTAVKYQLFQSFCTSMYGCELWSLSSHNTDDICIVWRKIYRSNFESSVEYALCATTYSVNFYLSLIIMKRH
jgi:hypothetical protein